LRDASLHGAGFGLTSRTCPNLHVVGSAVAEEDGDGESDGDVSDRDVPVVHFACVEDLADANGERAEVPEVSEVSSAPSPAERLAALARQVETLRKSLMQNRDALRAMETAAAASVTAGE
jgi:hypothetical protein